MNLPVVYAAVVVRSGCDALSGVMVVVAVVLAAQLRGNAVPAIYRAEMRRAFASTVPWLLQRKLAALGSVRRSFPRLARWLPQRVWREVFGFLRHKRQLRCGGGGKGGNAGAGGAEGAPLGDAFFQSMTFDDADDEHDMSDGFGGDSDSDDDDDDDEGNGQDDEVIIDHDDDGFGSFDDFSSGDDDEAQ